MQVPNAAPTALAHFLALPAKCSTLPHPTSIPHQFSRSVVSNSETPWTAVSQASLSITNSWGLIKLMSIELVMPSNHLILCCPLLLLPSIFPSIMVFSNELALTLNKYTFDSYTWCFNIDTSQSLMLIQGLGKIFLFILLKNSFVGYKILGRYQFSSVAQSYPTLQLHELQHARPSCPSPTPGVYSNSCPSTR